MKRLLSLFLALVCGVNLPVTGRGTLPVPRVLAAKSFVQGDVNAALENGVGRGVRAIFLTLEEKERLRMQLKRDPFNPELLRKLKRYEYDSKELELSIEENLIKTYLSQFNPIQKELDKIGFADLKTKEILEKRRKLEVDPKVAPQNICEFLEKFQCDQTLFPSVDSLAMLYAEMIRRLKIDRWLVAFVRLVPGKIYETLFGKEGLLAASKLATIPALNQNLEANCRKLFTVILAHLSWEEGITNFLPFKEQVQFRSSSEHMPYQIKFGHTISVFLSGADLSGTNLQNVSLNCSNLEKANFNGVNLHQGELNHVNFNGGSLEKAYLVKARFWNAEMNQAKLEEANLEEASLDVANLTAANLKKAFLFRASLKEVNLDSANLKSADLDWANLQDANLQKANLEEVVFNWTSLTRTQVTQSQYDMLTKKLNCLGQKESLRVVSDKSLDTVFDFALPQNAPIQRLTLSPSLPFDRAL